MTDKVELWKQQISDRKTSEQKIVDWSKEHKITKGSYHYGQRQVIQSQISSVNSAPETHVAAELIVHLCCLC